MEIRYPAERAEENERKRTKAISGSGLLSELEKKAKFLIIHWDIANAILENHGEAERLINSVSL